MRNICKDKKEWFRVVFETYIKGEGSIEGKDQDYTSFESIPEDEWEDILERNLQYIVRYVDWKNINVDDENVVTGGCFTDGGISGMNKLETGEIFYGFDLGGDWEIPVNAILYVEDGVLSFYAPECGNNYCISEWCAWSSQKDEITEAHEDDKLDAELELKDIEDYFHNRNFRQHAANPINTHSESDEGDYDDEDNIWEDDCWYDDDDEDDTLDDIDIYPSNEEEEDY